MQMQCSFAAAAVPSWMACINHRRQKVSKDAIPCKCSCARCIHKTHTGQMSQLHVSDRSNRHIIVQNAAHTHLDFRCSEMSREPHVASVAA
jgi:hypothetical protein